MEKRKSFLEKLSSTAFLYIAAGVGLISFFFMFGPAILEGSSYKGSNQLFFQEYDLVVGWPIFVGYMFVLLGSIACFVFTFSFIKPTVKQERFVLILLLVVLVLGSLTQFLTPLIYLLMKGIGTNMFSLYPLSFGPFVAGGLSLIAATNVLFALIVDWN